MSERTALRNPVVLLHGIDDTSVLFRHMVPQLERAGLQTHAMNLVPRNGDAGLDLLASQVAAWIEANFAAEQSIDLVGFSMGGLVARYYIQRLGGVERVRRFIKMSSPHKGTWTAFLRWNRGARQMRPGSDFLEDLNRDSATLGRIEFTTIWTPFDLIVPADSSRLGVGRSIRVNVATHPLMARDRRVLDLVDLLLTKDELPPAIDNQCGESGGRMFASAVLPGSGDGHPEDPADAEGTEEKPKAKELASN
jgi:triacylglycerol lipase